ncbi:hypothetical protein Droror1_Dr00027022 [Drosera rotundifolia]
MEAFPPLSPRLTDPRAPMKFRPPDGEPNECDQIGPPPSFKAAVTGNEERVAASSTERGHWMRQRIKVELLNEDRLFPKILVADVAVEVLKSPWANTLIIKVVDRSVGYKYLLIRVHQL